MSSPQKFDGLTPQQLQREKVRKMRIRIRIAGVIIILIYAWYKSNPDFFPWMSPAGAPRAVLTSSMKKDTFEKLTPIRQDFVKKQYAAGVKYYQGGQYEKSLIEIRKIFVLLDDYLDSREIESGAVAAQAKAAQGK